MISVERAREVLAQTAGDPDGLSVEKLAADRATLRVVAEGLLERVGNADTEAMDRYRAYLAGLGRDQATPGGGRERQTDELASGG